MLNFGIIGCGRISPNHVKAIADNRQQARLVAVCDLEDDKMDAAVARYNELMGSDAGTVRKYDDYMRLLANPDIDVVTIATYSGLHAQMAIDAMQAGKHVIVEKPMALSTTDADRMIKVAEQVGVKMTVSFQNRFNKSVQKLRSALEAQRFGKLVHGVASMRWHRGADYYGSADWRGTWAMDGGALMNQSIHNIDLLQWMMGDVDTAYGFAGTFLNDIEAEDAAVAVLRFKSGALGIIEASNCIYPSNMEETLSVFGEKGTAQIGGMATNYLTHWEFSDGLDDKEEVLANYGENPANVYGFGHTSLFADLIDAVQSGRQPYITPAEGKKAMEIVLGIYKSVKTGQPVKFPIGDFSTLDMR
ncbi:Gfo/Idh/MocA family oxidoreductase [Mahella sp.]|uniref:Gfo/Idh/MocA family protein n=1 Tax=Mahella sp. TaxID=2798721 RepID=UPI0025C6D663|nr:Gfo/Idh/MocA family oxidoreductase [Mahella sp.]MBZ4664896.1 oxidoreductase domain protein [Mahella sp.]